MALNPDSISVGSWPDWIAAVGTTLAFLVAAAAYALDVRTRRRAQAGLVYAKVAYITSHAPGDMVPMLGHGAAVGFGDVPWRPVVVDGESFTHLGAAAVVVTVEVHNRSAELLPVAYVEALRQGATPTPWPFSVSASPVDPQGEKTVELVCSNAFWPDGEPGVGVRITFQDSNGRWWRRTAAEPVRAASRKTRREVAPLFGRSPDRVGGLRGWIRRRRRRSDE